MRSQILLGGGKQLTKYRKRGNENEIKNKTDRVFLYYYFCSCIAGGYYPVGFGKVQSKILLQAYDLNTSPYEYLSNSIRLLNGFTRGIFEQLQQVAEQEPEKLENVKYLTEINNSLKEKYSYLLVRRGSELIFTGGGSLDFILPEYDNVDGSSNAGAYVDGEEQCIIKQIDFEYPNGDQGSVFLITSAGAMIPEIKRMVSEIMIAIALILIFTAGTLVAWIYKGFFNPIRKLQAAAENIKDGNLDFELEIKEKCDELGELCRSFEEMRIRLKESAEEKLSSEEENKVLISNISHDLKTPISAIKGYAEGIIDGVADTPEKMDKYVRTIYNKANEMNTLINELTIYSRIDTNRIPYNFSRINVADYFNDCVEELGMDLESKNIELAYFNYTDEAIQIIADPEQLKRVINNIVGNSVKYLDKDKGFINIRVQDAGDFIQVEIEDNGKGIAAKDLPYIFDRFYRTDTSRNSSIGGSGIGLSIVKKIIEDHGGSIWATSKEFTGTVMHFVIRKYQEVRNE